jgi:hypothetical protein
MFVEQICIHDEYFGLPMPILNQKAEVTSGIFPIIGIIKP